MFEIIDSEGDRVAVDSTGGSVNVVGPPVGTDVSAAVILNVGIDPSEGGLLGDAVVERF